MKKILTISGEYTAQEIEVLQDLITDFRARISDDDPEKNILNKKSFQFSDDKIVQFYKSAIRDINGGSPKTNYSIFSFYAREDAGLLVTGAIIFSLMAEGLLQLRNQMDFSDSGLNIALFNKSGAYQGWAGFMLQQYIEDKREFKRGIVPRSPNSGFIGISSEFDYGEW